MEADGKQFSTQLGTQTFALPRPLAEVRLRFDEGSTAGVKQRDFASSVRKEWDALWQASQRGYISPSSSMMRNRSDHTICALSPFRTWVTGIMSPVCYTIGRAVKAAQRLQQLCCVVSWSQLCGTMHQAVQAPLYVRLCCCRNAPSEEWPGMALISLCQRQPCRKAQHGPTTGVVLPVALCTDDKHHARYHFPRHDPSHASTDLVHPSRRGGALCVVTRVHISVHSYLHDRVAKLCARTSHYAPFVIIANHACEEAALLFSSLV